MSDRRDARDTAQRRDLKSDRLLAGSFEEPVNLGGHDEIVFVQTFDLFRLHHHCDVAPSKANIGVMTFGLGEFAHLLNERQRLAKVAKLEAPLNAPGLVA